MKVKDFIKLLQELKHQDAEVLIPDEVGGVCPVASIAEEEMGESIIICDKEMQQAFGG